MQNYDIEDDPIFKDFMQIKRDKAENTKRAYKTTLQDLCRANELPLNEIYKNCKEEQNDRIDNNLIIKFSPNDINTYTKQYFNNFISYIEVNKSLYETKSTKNKSNTINNKYRLLKAFFNQYDLVLPNWEKKEDDTEEWIPLKKSDIEYVVNDCNLEHTAMISFMMSTGIRESDVVELTIRDFMEATQKMGYHSYVDVEEFIDNAPADMIGLYEFYPKKTIKDRIPCMTLNNRESSNYILQSLRKIKNEYLPKYNRRTGENIKISKDHALFGSRSYNYLGHKKPHSVTQTFFKKNKKLREYYMSKIDEKIQNGQLSEEDKEGAIAEIPEFHPHALRKYFITTVRRHASNISYSAMMEGHAPPMPNDPSYVNITKDDVIKIYKKAIYELSLFEVDEDVIFDSKAEELRAEWAEEKAEWAEEKTQLNEKIQEKDEEITELVQVNQELQRKIDYHENRTTEIEDRVAVLENQMSHTQNTNPAIIPVNSEPMNIGLMIGIENLINYHKNNEENPQWLDIKIKSLKGRELIALKDITYDLVNKQEELPETLLELDPLLIRAIFKMEENPQLVQESVRYHNARSLNVEKIKKYINLLYDLLAEHVISDEEKEEWEAKLKYEKENRVMLALKDTKMDKVADAIALPFIENVDDYLLEEITEDFVMADIKRFFQVNVDE